MSTESSISDVSQVSYLYYGGDNLKTGQEDDVMAFVRHRLLCCNGLCPRCSCIVPVL